MTSNLPKFNYSHFCSMENLKIPLEDFNKTNIESINNCCLVYSTREIYVDTYLENNSKKINYNSTYENGKNFCIIPIGEYNDIKYDGIANIKVSNEHRDIENVYLAFPHKQDSNYVTTLKSVEDKKNKNFNFNYLDIKKAIRLCSIHQLDCKLVIFKKQPSPSKVTFDMIYYCKDLKEKLIKKMMQLIYDKDIGEEGPFVLSYGIGLLSKNAITKGSILDDFYDNIKKGLKPELKQY